MPRKNFDRNGSLQIGSSGHIPMEEPSSAIMRIQIKSMKEDLQGFAISELMSFNRNDGHQQQQQTIASPDPFNISTPVDFGSHTVTNEMSTEEDKVKASESPESEKKEEQKGPAQKRSILKISRDLIKFHDPESTPKAHSSTQLAS